MRELVFKNLTSKVSKKREVLLEETIHENGHVSKILKRSVYFVYGVRTITSPLEFQEWVQKQKENSDNTGRRYHILKIHSTRHKSDTVLCKAKGSFYVVCGMDVYNIVYVHSLRMEIANEKVG